MSKKNRMNPELSIKKGKDLREIYVHGTREPAAAIDELHNLYHKPKKIEISGGKFYRIESEDQSQSQYFEQKYRRKATLYECNGKVEQILGDSWYWNWNNFSVRALHFRAMNFNLPYDYNDVWYGNVVVGSQKFPELVFGAELRELDPLQLKELKEQGEADEKAMIKEWERQKKEELEKGGPQELTKDGGTISEVKPEELKAK